MSPRVASASLARMLPIRSSTARDGMAAASRIHVLAIGGSHQFAHIVPVACELERRFPGVTTVFVSSARDAEALRTFARSIAQPLPAVKVMALSAFGEKAIPGSLAKIARLLAWAKVINRAKVLLCAERTSTILPRLFPHCPPLLHIPHGAGDRAVGFERRFALFDHVLVAGKKDRDRLVASGVVAAKDCTVIGPIKLSTVIGQCAAPAPLFDNDRPTILYNPHFSPKYGSMEFFGRQLAEAVIRDGRYNLVIAPHMRLAQGWKQARRDEWEALAVPGRVVVDLGSERSCDMTYTLGADLYVGDVSSQVYEFLIRPRPCLFVDAHNADWQGSEDYAMWQLGEVVKLGCDTIAAIDRAFSEHATYLPRQKARMAYAIEGIAWAADGTPRLEGPSPASLAATIMARKAGLLEPMPLATVG